MRRIRVMYLLGMTVVSLGLGASLLGCDSDDDWDDPNRERYAAPPPEDDQVLTLEELERKWREEDSLDEAQRQEDRRLQRRANQIETSTQAAFASAFAYIEQAFELALSEFGQPVRTHEQPAPSGPAVGGGPPDHSSNAPHRRSRAESDAEM